MDITKDLFWTEYTDLDNKNGSFDGDEFIQKRKDIRYDNSNLWHQKYSLPCTKVLGLVAYRVKSNFLDICEAERSWVDVMTIKFGKRSAIRSDVSEKQSIVCTFSCIESAVIEPYHSDKN